MIQALEGAPVADISPGTGVRGLVPLAVVFTDKGHVAVPGALALTV